MTAEITFEVFGEPHTCEPKPLTPATLAYIVPVLSALRGGAAAEGMSEKAQDTPLHVLFVNRIDGAPAKDAPPAVQIVAGMAAHAFLSEAFGVYAGLMPSVQTDGES